MNKTNHPLEASISCQDPFTGTFRYSGSNRSFSVNKGAFTDFLRQQAYGLKLTQSRICFHSGDDSILQLMLVYHSSRHVARKHVHLDKDEYITIVDGRLTIRTYNDRGDLINSMLLSSRSDTDCHDLFCYLPKGVIHDVLMHEDSFFVETTTGPFHKLSTVYTNLRSLE